MNFALKLVRKKWVKYIIITIFLIVLITSFVANFMRY